MISEVKNTVINAALAYEINNGKGEQWRRVFNSAINDLPTKAGRTYRFLVAMSGQKSSQMDKVIRVLLS